MYDVWCVFLMLQKCNTKSCKHLTYKSISVLFENTTQGGSQVIKKTLWLVPYTVIIIIRVVVEADICVLAKVNQQKIAWLFQAEKLTVKYLTWERFWISTLYMYTCCKGGKKSERKNSECCTKFPRQFVFRKFLVFYGQRLEFIINLTVNNY